MNLKKEKKSVTFAFFLFFFIDEKQKTEVEYTCYLWKIQIIYHINFYFFIFNKMIIYLFIFIDIYQFDVERHIKLLKNSIIIEAIINSLMESQRYYREILLMLFFNIVLIIPFFYIFKWII